MRALTIGLIFGLALIGRDVMAQRNYVVCQSLLNPDVTSVFPDRCPSGWIFIDYA